MANKCSDEKTLLQDVKFCQGKKSLPGTKKRVYIADCRDILTYPKVADRNAAGFTLDKVPVLTGNFALAADKYFVQVDIINNNGQITVEAQGTFGSKTFKCTYRGNAPGTEEEITGLIAELLNAEISRFLKENFRVLLKHILERSLENFLYIFNILMIE